MVICGDYKTGQQLLLLLPCLSFRLDRDYLPMKVITDSL